jgi:hypothetical protein
MHRLIIASVGYAAAFHFAYVVFLYPVFEYAHFYYFPPSLPLLILTYALAIAPVVGLRESTLPAFCGAALVFVICYVPAQLTLLFTWQRETEELVIVQAALAASMAILFRAALLGHDRTAVRRSEAGLVPVVTILTGASILALLVSYGSYMRLVSFEDVYELRFESNEAERGALTDYLVSWLSYCFLPFYMARGIVRKSWVEGSIAAIVGLLIYAATGSKAAVLTPAIVIALSILFGVGGAFLFRLLCVLTVVVVLVAALLPNDPPLLWIKSILLLRVLGTGGWTMSHYYEYFSNNGFTYYTHIGAVNALTGAYPYDYALGQLIGLEYSGSAEANFNGNFWASDAFAALGVLGIPIVTIALALVFSWINRIASAYSARFVFLWLSGFWLALLNVPLSTALLSGGGLVTIGLLWLLNRDWGRRFAGVWLKGRSQTSR